MPETFDVKMTVYHADTGQEYDFVYTAHSEEEAKAAMEAVDHFLSQIRPLRGVYIS